MKKIVFTVFMILTLLGCQEVIDNEMYVGHTEDFEAVTEDFSALSKTGMDELRNVIWSEGDLLAIFQGCTMADKYQVSDASVGKSNGTFKIVSDDSSDINGDFSSGGEIATNIAVYPYSDDLSCTNAVVTDGDSGTSVSAYSVNGFVLPEVQAYSKNSFGDDTFPMVAVTTDLSDHSLKFKNVCGGMKLQLKGTQKVTSVKLEGKNKEKLSGAATLMAYPGDLSPAITMSSGASTSVTLDCGDGVQLNESTATEFIISLPPVLFSKGFTVTVTDGNNKTYTVETDRANTVLRSSLLVMPESNIDTGEQKKFDVSFKGYGPGYVSVMVTQPNPTTVAYVVLENPIPNINPTLLYVMGTQTTLYSEGEQQLLDYPVEANTKYYVYLVGLLGDNFSQLYEYEFETGEFVFNQLATIIGVNPDGYKVHIKVPESVKTTDYGVSGSRALRYTHCNLMEYNMMRQATDDYGLLLASKNYIRECGTLEMSNNNNYAQVDYDVNGDGVIDESDMDYLWSPVAPGEPIVFLAGEFEWMQKPDGWPSQDLYEVNGFLYPENKEAGYYLPCLDPDKYWGDLTNVQEVTKGVGIIKDIDKSTGVDRAWTGAFQRKLFRTRVPHILNSSLDITIEGTQYDEIAIRISPNANVYRYIFMILDETTYQYMLELLDYREEYLQWAVTSYLAYVKFGSIAVKADTGYTSAKAVEIKLSDAFGTVPSDKTFHVLVTGMSGEIGSPQCFCHKTFSL